MSKFKVGDKVRGSDANRYGITNKEMKLGEVVEVSNLNIENDICVKIVEHAWPHEIGKSFWVSSKYFELIEPRREFIVIRRDGSDVIAEQKRGKQIVKTAKAKCAPSDEFNFETGAKLAFDRLMGRQNIDEAIKAWNEPSPAPEPPKYYTGKVFAVKTIGSIFTESIVGRNGRVFEIVNGVLQNPTAGMSTFGEMRYQSFEEFKRMWLSTEWVEVRD